MKTTKTDKEKFDGFITTEIVVQCTAANCRNGDGAYDLDEYYFIEELIEKGWRATDRNCYCPDCAKKRLKKK